MKTWRLEAAFVASVLLTVWASTGYRPVELLGAGAVLLSFMHTQVSDRMAEKEALRTTPDVECHRWSVRYLVAKELCWLGYFTATQSWSALVGVGVFLAYPAWRTWYRTKRPLRAAS
jgi:hypothetical protein